MGPITIVVIHDIGCRSMSIRWHMHRCKGLTGRWRVTALRYSTGLVLRTDGNIGICRNLPISMMVRAGWLITRNPPRRCRWCCMLHTETSIEQLIILHFQYWVIRHASSREICGMVRFTHCSIHCVLVGGVGRLHDPTSGSVYM
jgi:hypothetical protein